MNSDCSRAGTCNEQIHSKQDVVQDADTSRTQRIGDETEGLLTDKENDQQTMSATDTASVIVTGDMLETQQSVPSPEIDKYLIFCFNQ